jgi:hypothetical protein
VQYCLELVVQLQTQRVGSGIKRGSKEDEGEDQSKKKKVKKKKVENKFGWRRAGGPYDGIVDG